MLEKLFGLSKAGTSVKTEVMAGIATFLTMAYITVVNPAILSTEGSGMGFGAVFTATIIAAVIGTLIMGLWANWPVALAPGMGLNAFFTFGVIFGMGYTYQQALAAVFVAGLVFIALSVTPARKYIINSIPKSMKLGVGAGIGLFLAIIGLKNAGVVVDNPATLVGLGDVTSWPVLLTGLGFIIMAVLDKRKVPGAIILGILAVSAIAWATGISQLNGLAGAIPNPEHAFSSAVTGSGSNGGSFGPFTYTFATAQTVSTSARIRGSLGASSGQVGGTTNVIKVDGTDVTQKFKDAGGYAGSNVWVTVTTEVGSTWSTFTVQGVSGSTNPNVSGIEIDGVQLISSDQT